MVYKILSQLFTWIAAGVSGSYMTFSSCPNTPMVTWRERDKKKISTKWRQPCHFPSGASNLILHALHTSQMRPYISGSSEHSFQTRYMCLVTYFLIDRYLNSHNRFGHKARFQDVEKCENNPQQTSEGGYHLDLVVLDCIIWPFSFSNSASLVTWWCHLTTLPLTSIVVIPGARLSTNFLSTPAPRLTADHLRS